jgi:NAD(P)H-hydrate epimerase
MEHAARGVAEVAAWLLEPGSQALVVCGPGNNGGDGYGVARFLCAWGRRVRILAAHPPAAAGDPAWEAASARRAGIPILEGGRDGAGLREALAAGPGLIVDALFGVGLTRPLGGPDRALIAALERSPALRLAVDVPSGLDAGTGQPLPVALRADVTATMVAPKQGFAVGAAWVGHVVEIDIGLPPALHPPRRQETG